METEFSKNDFNKREFCAPRCKVDDFNMTFKRVGGGERERKESLRLEIDGVLFRRQGRRFSSSVDCCTCSLFTATKQD